METIDDVLDHLSGIVGSKDEMYFPEYSERVYVDSSYREQVTALLTSLGLPRATAPDEKTEFDYGLEYAKFLEGQDIRPVDLDYMVSGSIDIPSGDYKAMKSAGIKNPCARKFWEGYNSFFVK